MTKLLRTEQECIEYIHSAGRFGKKAGLCNIKALLGLLGDPHRELRCIHVAGTNGKGSVSSMLRNILTSAGFKTGMNTSPYIEEFNERLSIDGQNIPAEKLVYYTNLVADAIDKAEDLHPIEFEIITAIGFLYFRDEKCDYAVIECGIGGLYDSTNVIESPEMCLICRIGLDHTEILGETIEDIATQKSGIIKHGTRVVVHPETDDVSLSVIRSISEEKGADFYHSQRKTDIISQNINGTHFTLDGMDIHLPLMGDHQIQNALLAIRASEIMGIDREYIIKGIAGTRWMCRFEDIGSNIIIDGAHNHQGIDAFVRGVKKYVPEENRVFVIGMLNDKDFASSAEALSTLDGRFIITDVPSYRQTNGRDVYDRILSYIPHAEYERDYTRAIDRALMLRGDNGYLCVAGSLYLAGAVRKYINKS